MDWLSQSWWAVPPSMFFINQGILSPCLAEAQMETLRLLPTLPSCAPLVAEVVSSLHHHPAVTIIVFNPW